MRLTDGTSQGFCFRKCEPRLGTNDCHQQLSCAPGLCATHARNGYCTIDGCAFSSLEAYQCPAGSGCSRLYPGGACLKECTLADATSCRGHAADRLGDYECRAWNNISVGGRAVTPSPVCDFGDSVACHTFKNLGCDAFGDGISNPTKMSCRDLTGKELPDPRDPLGLCLDDTASGS